MWSAPITFPQTVFLAIAIQYVVRGSIKAKGTCMKDGGKGAQVASGGPMGAVLFIAYIGAAVYFWGQATGFWGHVWALLKAIAWPAVLVYQSLQAFGV